MNRTPSSPAATRPSLGAHVGAPEVDHEARRDPVEDVRLAALRDSGALDAATDETLNRLTRLAGDLLGVPVSLLSLVDAQRQFFAAQHGLAEPWSSFRETPLSHSFCRHVVERDAPMLVEDATRHPVLSQNLAVPELGVVAYAGVPLRLPTGATLGAFCAIDNRSRTWSARDVRVLEDLAALAGEVLDLRRLRRQSTLHDPLTGLPDPDLFAELVHRAVTRAVHRAGRVAVAVLDVAGFGLITTALGQAAGDDLLAAIGVRLGSLVRDDDAVCRLSADRFAVLYASVAGDESALALAERLAGALTGEPLSVGDERLTIAVRKGVATTATPISGGELVQAAVTALTRTVIGDPAALEPTEPDRRERAVHRLHLRNDIHGAHERGEVTLVYQPIVHLATGSVAGVEALMRWKHPELGSISPGQFIPAAEDSGAIVPLGTWALRQACADLTALRASVAAPDLTMAVNVAPVQLRTASFAATVQQALETSELDPSALTIEIIERSVLDEVGPQRRTLDVLRALGVHIALDDFGTGYSALGYLTRFPVDVLKIDRSFVSGAGASGNGHSRALIEGIATMARGLGLRTVAEGIERDDERAAVAAAGCDQGQGYLFARPVPYEQLVTLIGTPGSRVSA